MTCSICKQKSERLFSGKILGKYNIDYFHCTTCGFTETEKPRYWLEEAYDSPMNLSDTGVLERNIYFSHKVSALIHNFFDINAQYLDYSGGYGVFTRLMRDIGYDFYWNDPYTKNLLARGFEYDPGKQKKIELLTTFEVFEHLVDPVKEISDMLKVADTVVFSTQLVPEPIPAPSEWWYYGLEHGQHISLYRPETLTYIANKLGVDVFSHGEFHMFTKKKLIPKIVDKAWMSRAKKVLDPQIMKLLIVSYRPIHLHYNGALYKRVAHQLMQLKGSTYYILDNAIDRDKKMKLSAELKRCGLLDQQYEDLSNNAIKYEQTFALQDVKSRTYDDMLAMKAVKKL